MAITLDKQTISTPTAARCIGELRFLLGPGNYRTVGTRYRARAAAARAAGFFLGGRSPHSPGGCDRNCRSSSDESSGKSSTRSMPNFLHIAFTSCKVKPSFGTLLTSSRIDLARLFSDTCSSTAREIARSKPGKYVPLSQSPIVRMPTFIRRLSSGCVK